MTENEQTKNEKRVGVSSSAYELYAETKETLKQRGINDFSFLRFLDLVLKKIPASTISQVVEENTPKEYRIKLALNDESLMDEFLKLVEIREKKRLRDKSTEVTQ